MNYIRIYNQLINKARQRKSAPDIVEMHHVIPLCIGGLDDEDNLVALSPKEHFVAHHLLHKIYPESHSLFYAYWAMHTYPREGLKINAQIYHRARSKLSELRSEMSWWNDGEREVFTIKRPAENWIAGRIKRKWWNDGSITRQFTSNPGSGWSLGRLNTNTKGIVWWTDGIEEKKSKDCPGKGWKRGRKDFTEEYKDKMKTSTKGIVWWTDGIEEKKSKDCPGKGWKRGRKPRG